MSRLPRFLSLLAFSALLLAAAGCDSGTPPTEIQESVETTVSFSTSALSALEEDSPVIELPVQINNPGGSEVTVEVLFAQAASNDDFTPADLGITQIDESNAFRDDDTGDLTAYMVGSVTFRASAEDGDVRTVELSISDEEVEEEETGVFVLQNLRTEGTGNVSYGTPRELEVTISAEGTVTLVSEDFQTEDEDGGVVGELGVFTAYNVASSTNWETGSGGGAANAPYAIVNGFGADAASNDWLISPALDFNSVEAEVLTFLNAKGYDDGGLDAPALRVLVSTDYSGEGDPTDANWTDVTDRATLARTSDQTDGPFSPFISSGEVDLSDDAFQSDETYVAFQYTSTGTGGGTTEAQEIDNVVISGRETGE